MSNYNGEVIASKLSSEKVFHYRTCRFATNINQNNIISFRNKTEARNNGYRQCNCCSRMLKYYNQDKEKIDNFIKLNLLNMFIEDDAMYIDSIFYSWKIIISPNGYNVILYHANTEHYKNLKIDDRGHLIHSYHLQNYKGASDILHMLKYIVEHDKWKMESIDDYKSLPRNSKRQQISYNRAERQAIRIKNRNLENLMFKLKLYYDSIDSNKKK